MKIKLNEKGEKLYNWLANRWLDVYGFNAQMLCFLICDDVTMEWRWISIHECIGTNTDC